METIFIGSAKIICCSSVTSYWIFTLCQILCQLLWGATRLFNEFFEYFLYARHYMKCLSIKIFKSLDKISFKTIQFYASVRPQFINQFFFFFLATPSACRSSLGQRLNPYQWQHWILNPLHKRTLWLKFLTGPLFEKRVRKSQGRSRAGKKGEFL